MPEIIHGFANMNATIKIRGKRPRLSATPPRPRDPSASTEEAWCISEGGGVGGLGGRRDAFPFTGWNPRSRSWASVWTSDSYHFTLPNPENHCHEGNCRSHRRRRESDLPTSSTSMPTAPVHPPKGTGVEIECLRDRFSERTSKNIPVSSNKSQIGHTLGGLGRHRGGPGHRRDAPGSDPATVNHIPDPELADVDVVPNIARRQPYDLFLSNAFGFGGTNCCIVFKGGVRGMLP